MRRNQESDLTKDKTKEKKTTIKQHEIRYDEYKEE